MAILRRGPPSQTAVFRWFTVHKLYLLGCVCADTFETVLVGGLQKGNRVAWGLPWTVGITCDPGPARFGVAWPSPSQPVPQKTSGFLSES